MADEILNWSAVNEISFDPGRTLTFADLRRFVVDCERLGVAGTSELAARVTMGGRLRRLTARNTAPPAVTSPTPLFPVAAAEKGDADD